MGEFFQGWRRKFGCLTLVMACLFMGGWVRSLQRWDTVLFNFGINKGFNRADIYVMSSDGYIAWEKSDDVGFPKPLELFEWDAANPDSVYAMCGTCEIKSNLFWLTAFDSDGTVRVRLLPYWFITIPLTLTSLFLLLSKPRKSTQKKNDEPIHEEGT